MIFMKVRILVTYGDEEMGSDWDRYKGCLGCAGSVLFLDLGKGYTVLPLG